MALKKKKGKKGRINLDVAMMLFLILGLSLSYSNLVYRNHKSPNSTKLRPTISKINFNQYQSEERFSNLSIEVNIPAAEMALYEDGVEVFRKRVAVGQSRHPTPEKTSFIQIIEWNPWWYPPDAPWAKNDKPTPPGPRNPLGPVKLRVGNASEILMHGTNKSWSVGRPSSHGCMRMINEDASSLAWYLQSKSSEKNDPELLDMYRKRNRSTFRVKLERPVPIKLVYEPIVVRDDNLIFYPDHYKRVKGSLASLIISELLSNGLNIEVFDEEKINQLSKNLPNRMFEIPLSELLIGYEGPKITDAPECS